MKKTVQAGILGAAALALPFASSAEDKPAETIQVAQAETTVAAADAENVSFQTDRNFIIRYNPNAEGHSPTLFRDTISDIQLAGCDNVELQTRRYGADYTLKAPWFRGGNSFTVDDIGTVGGIAIDLCQDGDLGSGPA